MADRSKIEWTDSTWNPVTGCDEVSPGCDHCYAKRTAERFRGVEGHFFERGFDVTLRPEMLDRPLRWRRPRRVFVGSMTDLFHPRVPDEYIARVWAVMALTPRHTFQVLTKRPARMRSLLSSEAFHRLVVREALPYDRSPLGPRTITLPLPNVWLGVSVEDQAAADVRIPILLGTPAPVRWLSCEPLLGPVVIDYEPVMTMDSFIGNWPRPSIDWVVVGGESGAGARPMRIDWVRSLRDQCEAAGGVPFLFKQWGDASAWRDRLRDIWHQRADGLLDSFETAPFSRDYVTKKWGPLTRVGKKEAGRVLDGRVWDEYPNG